MISKLDIEKECKRLEKSIEHRQNFIDNADEGFFKCFRNGNKWSWYIIKNVTDEKGNVHKKRTYLPKRDWQTACDYVKKAIYKSALIDEKQELKALRSYLKNSSSFDRVDKYINKNEEIENISKTFYNGKFDETTRSWLKDVSSSNDLFPDGLQFRCKNGLMVRSKSEQLIATALINYNIPFKYENRKMLGLNEYFPDFTILSPKDGEEYLWEHFGKMDDENYVCHSLEKIKHYNENGYIPFDKLIMTFESNNSGVDQMWIDRIIETFFI